MTDNIVPQDISALLDGWIEAERNGVQFPVPFDLAWGIAGYSRKDVAKRKLTPSMEGKLFHRNVVKTAGRGLEQISMTTDALKHLCLLAETTEGDQVRQYFIEAEKKWKLVQQVAPRIAEEVEILHLKIELAKQEAIAAVANEKAQSLRHYVVTALPKPTADRILGITEVKEIEYRDRVIKNDRLINSGDTINKTGLCKRYSFVTKNGSPDYKKLNAEIASLKLPEDAWQDVDVLQSNRELKREYLDELDRCLYTCEQRQMWLGE